MSAELANPPSETAQPALGPERKYRAVNGFAVASLVFGVLSALTLVGWSMAVFPIAGILMAWLAFRRFRRNPEEQTGRSFAKWGLSLSIGLWSVGYGYLTYLYYTAAPPGYLPISYKALQPDPTLPDELVPPLAEELHKNKQRVFVRGYMFRARQRSGIKEFVLVDDPGACSFCAPKPKVTQLILVKLKGSLRTDFTTHMVGVGGEFSLHKEPEKEMGGLYYKIEADVIK